MFFYFPLEFCIYFELFSVSVGIKSYPCSICYDAFSSKCKISRCGSRSPNKAEFCHFVLLFYQELNCKCTAIVLLIEPFVWWRLFPLKVIRSNCRRVLRKITTDHYVLRLWSYRVYKYIHEEQNLSLVLFVIIDPHLKH